MTTFIQLLTLFGLIIFVQSSIIFLVIKKFSKNNKFVESTGVPIGTNVLNVIDTYLASSDKKMGNSHYLLFVDVECQQCKRILEAFPLLDNTVSSLFSIIVREEQAKDNLYNNIYHDLSFNYLPDNVIFGSLRVKAFPYFMKIDKDGNLENKSYATRGNLLEYL